MATLDLLILIVYVTFMIYVVYRARQSLLDQKAEELRQLLRDKYVLSPDMEQLQKELDRQLEAINLKGAIAVELGRNMIMPLENLKQLPITVNNRTTTYAVYVDWQESALTNLNRNARSLACVTPNQGQSQSPSLVPPGDRLQENFTVAQAEPKPLIEPNIARQILTKNNSCQVILRLVLKLRTVGGTNLSHLIALTCPYNLRIFTMEDLVAKR